MLSSPFAPNDMYSRPLARLKRNPRMVLGIARAGRLIIVTETGRQPGYSDGWALTEAAELVRCHRRARGGDVLVLTR